MVTQYYIRSNLHKSLLTINIFEALPRANRCSGFVVKNESPDNNPLLSLRAYEVSGSENLETILSPGTVLHLKK